MAKASEMRVSDNGTNFVKKWEGLYLNAYRDIVGVWTIGYGNTKKKYAYAGNKLAGEWEAHAILKEDLEEHMVKARQQITIDLNQNQYDAIASFCFNLGANILTGSSLLSYINSGQWTKAGDKMLEYCNAGGKFVKGLYNRRVDERRLLLNTVQPPNVVIPPDEKPENGGYDSSWFTKQDGVFTLDRSIKLRTTPSVNTDDNIIAVLNAGDKVTYDAYGYEAWGYVWLRQVRSGGRYGYIASGDTSNGKRVSSWGTFE